MPVPTPPSAPLWPVASGTFDVVPAAAFDMAPRAVSETDSAADPAVAPASDPYLALEALDDPEVGRWLDAQNDRTHSVFGHTPDSDALTQRLLRAYTAEDRIVSCWRVGDWAYNTWQDAEHRLGIVRRTPWQSWLDGTPNWDVVLDIDALDLNQAGASEHRWALKGFSMLRPDHDRVLVRLSPGGADACIVREFDIASRTFVADGFTLPDVGKHHISWIDRDTVYVGWDDSAHTPTPALTSSGLPREARRWTRGTAVADAPVVFRGEESDVVADAHYDREDRLHLASRAVTFFEAMHFWRDDASQEWRQYDIPLHAELQHWDGWLFITPREAWSVGGERHPSGSLLAIRRDAFLAGERRFAALFTPGERQVLSGVDVSRRFLVVSTTNDGVPAVTLWTPPRSGREWHGQALALPAGQCDVSPIDFRRDDTALVYVEHYLTPPSLFHVTLGSDAPWHLLAQLPARFDSTGLVAERRHASAPDGVQIPYWLVGREAAVRGAAAPCLLYGYGGFEIALDPRYDATTGIGWLEAGNLYAVANIRGGGEFGPDWHRAAQRGKRQVAFDDFIAVAQSLIDSGATTAAQLAISGGSNGGLLTGVCLVQRPDLFGAVVSEVPLLDMARFHLLLQGASWIDEYGDPDVPEDLRVLLTYSPYQNVREDAAYPPVLFTTSSADDRVHPGHARKMAARMQAQGHAQVWYLENREGGHGAGIEPETIARQRATVFDFLRRTVGAV
ncbi:prolyl oligopeptidase family serine peptidase [Robbsia sp. Bb-Pol-6]|uniref:Prolyl oligopeptidase family serine peptidase n=1 Tax=Robbsia betulipollinis TaxID=2981849 RepID=A0ABT3ZKH7_9BURK|nr:prolyl oligopeptidase family serine peptidase [Robbsia betulipollinis]MCY0387039.1 prolyl oligopeptidase family serine peptidase [Robbsia betulipollinis]